MYRYHALGGASLFVLGSALSLMPSVAEAQTALPAVTVEAPRATGARPAARKPASAGSTSGKIASEPQRRGKARDCSSVIGNPTSWAARLTALASTSR